MCRMLVVSGGPHRSEILRAFRKQATHGREGPPAARRHQDGWGMVLGDGRLHLLERRPTDASSDPAFEAAVTKAEASSNGFVLTHLRDASIGSKTVANTHPFVADGWAFAHNGTIHDAGRIEIEGARYEGETDSERYFRRYLHHWNHLHSPEAALRMTVHEVRARCTFSSLTALFTDGTTVYGYRGLGTDISECGTAECHQAYYTLGYGRRGETIVIAQEYTHLGTVQGWQELPDDAFLTWNPPAPPSWRILGTVARTTDARSVGTISSASTNQRT